MQAMKTRSRQWLAFVGVILALMGAAPMLAAEDGAATLEELIEKCKGAETMADMVPLVYPGDRPMLGMAISMSAAMLPMQMSPDVINEENEAEVNAMTDKLMAEYEALEEKHGLGEPTAEGFEERAAETFEGVDIAAYAADVQVWITEAAGDTLSDNRMIPDFSSLENVQEDGDSATAVLMGQPVEFIRSDGRWFMRMEM